MPKHITVADETTANFVLPSQVGAANGVAGLDGTGKVPLGQLPTIAAGSVTSVNGQVGIVNLNAGSVSAVATSQVGTANGVAGLDATGKLPTAQLPAGMLTSASIGVANGIAGLDSAGFLDLTHVRTNAANALLKLDGTGKIPASQSKVNTVNGADGVVVLTAASVGAVDATEVGANNGVASLNSSGKVPQTELPDLSNLYVPVPGATATAAGQLYSSTGPGSNSAQWVSPLMYTAANQAARPVAPPTGSLVTQTDIDATFIYGGSQWFRADTDIGIPKYASAAARDVDFPSPADGQHIYRTDLHQMFWYNGTAWLAVSEGAWTTYTPTWSGLTTLGAATSTGRYIRTGSSVEVVGSLTWGAGSALGSGTISATLPFTSLSLSNNMGWQGTGKFRQDSASWRPIMADVANGDNHVVMMGLNTSLVYVTPGAAGYTWSTPTAYMRFQVTFEVP